MREYVNIVKALDALDAIRYRLWEIDIPSPTVPEYVEHHEQITELISFVDKLKGELIKCGEQVTTDD